MGQSVSASGTSRVQRILKSAQQLSFKQLTAPAEIMASFVEARVSLLFSASCFSYSPLPSLISSLLFLFPSLKFDHALDTGAP